MRFDLHVHTNYSDGKFTPEEVIELAIEKGLDGIAITDHDTVAGLEQAVEYSGKYKDFKLIPGIELGTIYNNEEVHILGYFIDYNSKEIHDATQYLRENRIIRGKKIISKLQGMGIDINEEEVNKLSKDGFTGRLHIAKILTIKNYTKSIDEAFSKFLSKDAPAYVERKTLNIKDSIKLINEAGGVAVLAHPGLLKDKTKIINYTVKSGIQGIECMHSKHTKENTKRFIRLAKKNNLLITAGSDCHGRIIDGDLLLGDYFVNESKLSKIKELI